jgi:hypothetical protein
VTEDEVDEVLVRPLEDRAPKDRGLRSGELAGGGSCE